MRNRFAIGLLFSLLAIGGAAHAKSFAGPQPVDPDQAEWSTPPQIPGLQAAWLLGDSESAAPYLMQVKLAKDAVIPPHRHSDTRHTLVLEGVLYIGFGEPFDKEALVAVPAGRVYEVKAGTPHFLTALDGAVRYQETGHGPTTTEMVGAKP